MPHRLPQPPKRPARNLILALGILTLAALATAPSAWTAAGAQAKGLAIAKEADRRDTGWGDWRAEVEMILKNAQGQTSQRKMKMSSLEFPSDGDKTIIVFDWPKDIDGTALLTYTHKTGDDDQWLFLPALKRIKRISSSNKSGSFVGSEFSYEDLSSQEVEKYKYKYLRDEKCGSLTCYVSERIPVDENSGYTKQIVWTDKGEYRVQKIVFYDRKSSKLKTLVFTGYKQYLGKFWRAATLTMVNHQSGKSTVLAWKNYKFRTGLKNRDFTRNSLKRAR
ncbi:MAG: outer membrane lipoprotein-sorting protein [Alphaproteobacteria bacterium]